MQRSLESNVIKNDANFIFALSRFTCQSMYSTKPLITFFYLPFCKYMTSLPTRIEFTTQNLYFHENASIYSIDSSQSILLTAGGDKCVRSWSITKEPVSDEETFIHNESYQSSVKIIFQNTYEGHTRSINCVRFHPNNLLFGSAADNGEIILWYSDTKYKLEIENDDIYELCFGTDHLFVGLASGKLLVYALNITIDEKILLLPKLVQNLKAHTDIIQGMSFNYDFNCLLTGSRDRTYKTFVMEKKLVFNEKIEAINNEKAFADENCKLLFRRSSFIHGNYVYLTGGIEPSDPHLFYVYVYHYPFRNDDLYCRIGPLDSHAVKVLSHGKYTIIICKKNVYFCEGQKMIFNIKHTSFYPLTDAAMCDDILLCSSLDGFLYTLRFDNK